MSETELNKEIGHAQALLANERDRHKRPKRALCLAKLIKAKGDYKRVVRILDPYKECRTRAGDEIRVCYGHALCRLNNPGSAAYQKGQQFMERVAAPQDPLPSQKTTTDARHKQPTRLKQRAKALYYLGYSYGRQAVNIHRARHCFYQAHQLDKSNPYTFAAFVEFDLYSRKDKEMIPLLLPLINTAIKSCREDIRQGKNGLKPYFTIGRLCFMLEAVDKTLSVYTRAIDLFVCGKTHIPLTRFDDELEALTRLCHAQLNRSLFEWIEQVFLLARVVGYSDDCARKRLQKLKQIENALRPPVLIVAGGAKKMATANLPAYRNLLTHCLQNYKGTVIAGGTTSGIPGLVGVATREARRNHNHGVQLIGYLPKFLPGSAKTDENYDKLVFTQSKSFGLREPIQYWIDLVMNGTNPADVYLLGINGGWISAMEYRLALALGARVGVVESSGRAVDELLCDEDWADHPRILVISHDAPSAWKVVN